jgi:hypothetical protein
MVATYAEWAAGIEAQFIAYATQKNQTQTHDVALCEKRLLLLEKDPAIRALVQAVHDAFARCRLRFDRGRRARSLASATSSNIGCGAGAGA